MAEQRTSPATDLPAGQAWWLPRLRIEHLWLAVPIFLVVGFGFLLKLRLVDFWWHLKIGEIIVNTRAIPRTDLFSFTAAGQPFILQNWLVEVLYYLTYRAGGLPLLVTLNAALLVAALLPVYSLCRRSTNRLRLGVVVAILPAVSLIYFGSVRSQVFSFALLSAFYWILHHYHRRQRDLLWALPVLMALWVNLHGAFVIGLALIGLFLCCEAASRLFYGAQSNTLTTGELSKLGLILMLTALATLVNPETYRVYGYILAVATNPASQALVVEWQPPRVDELESLLLFYGPFFISLLVLLYARRRPLLIELALFLAFAIFGLKALRNGVWFTLIAAPILARHLPTIRVWDFIQPLRRFRLVDSFILWVARRKDAVVPIRYRLNRQIALVMLTILVLVSPWIYPHLGNKLFGSTLWEPSTPVGAMDYIQQQRLQGNIFHPQIYGDYLIWRLWPQQRSFIDGRVHLFDNSVIRDYRLAFNDPHWDERLARYDIRYLLLSKVEEENHLMADTARTSNNWQVLYEDEQSILFEKIDHKLPAS